MARLGTASGVPWLPLCVSVDVAIRKRCAATAEHYHVPISAASLVSAMHPLPPQSPCSQSTCPTAILWVSAMPVSALTYAASVLVLGESLPALRLGRSRHWDGAAPRQQSSAPHSCPLITPRGSLPPAGWALVVSLCLVDRGPPGQSWSHCWPPLAPEHGRRATSPPGCWLRHVLWAGSLSLGAGGGWQHLALTPGLTQSKVCHGLHFTQVP